MKVSSGRQGNATAGTGCGDLRTVAACGAVRAGPMRGTSAAAIRPAQLRPITLEAAGRLRYRSEAGAVPDLRQGTAQSVHSGHRKHTIHPIHKKRSRYPFPIRGAGPTGCGLRLRQRSEAGAVPDPRTVCPPAADMAAAIRTRAGLTLEKKSSILENAGRLQTSPAKRPEPKPEPEPYRV